MSGELRDVISSAWPHLHNEVDLKTHDFSQRERALTQALVGASMADLIWRSDTDPNEKKSWDPPKVAPEVASLVVGRAAREALTFNHFELDFKDWSTNKQLRDFADQTSREVWNYLQWHS